MTQKVVVIYSGGMDSFTVLNKALQQGREVYALSFDYGQRHVKELKVAASVCEKLGVPHKIVDISAINQLIGGSSLTDDIDVPEGHYEAENMKSTIVPNRNMILLSLAVGYAVSLKASQVYYGAHSGDHAIYPDCRPEFVQKMDDLCRIANYDAVEIFSPYLNDTKIDILTDGLKMGLDYSQTWTCYNGREKACGKCGACQERLEAFSLNNITDPIEYE
ncbi:7-cyano-7-deazaguanine synthase QueC [Pseudoalteromonas sp. SR44-5]|jgi:7-cyano-7-deazaguanine synthase|uniref:7-cyano-7-deazaguanine synthase n=2 Tax=Pseudoalteromonas TaxID=53246 RepID=A0ABY3FB58_9GAMM|nr:7-cyano-7-deazaguanine synthase QueC [Pseudoalteromonas rhizosphaerae]MBB1293035.1 7-cyano-7-deazaguanine synthase QueC [Pseudoalteromonas sp. SR41-4]MBB1303458.1 7-cyano-7-deazaguanine synthase QueC [Pseudoalteromonas sp. SR44-8]MBB1309072.1 7-cyano-7-deazaguanine synthase QueC [Pseudoalteromonas sp. SR41-8]MBB1335776.1 7-cyano-7-deazaguanine synthase QueC [Pseudoalteromonas sp. SR41-6]MBB1342621.1 7-cyano-7-deazaguanine synthase QueC [Pseudoalteromonas sp. SR45-6]MBB1368567.1 7-cyano-7-d|tara:strand:+ start:3025 stop:3681 length:657 start_codon:yes stop_codon:yes gene_type:complete